LAATWSLSPNEEPEWRARRDRIDPKLRALGWELVPGSPQLSLGDCTHHAVTEYPTKDGSADYALLVDGQLVGIVEAKRLGLSPQNPLTQAERYARGIGSSPFDFDGCRVPFLYSTNGELIWFRDVRHPLNRSRELAAFHTPSGLTELLKRDFESGTNALAALPNDHPVLRPYQVEANQAIVLLATPPVMYSTRRIMSRRLIEPSL
jgi:type I restriction enzyme, R subunit